MYEVVDSFPVLFMAPLYQHQWGLMVGFINCFLRLGSVFNFILSPLIYHNFGLSAAFWASSVVSSIGVACALLIVVTINHVPKPDKGHNTTQTDNDENHEHAQPITPCPPNRLRTAINIVCSKILLVLPINLFSKQYFYFLLGGAALYGSMVPFWFVGTFVLAAWIHNCS